MRSLFPLTLTGATIRRKGKRLVGPIDLTLQDQGITIVIGPNGAGKTSLLRMMHGIARLSDGAINWGCDLDTAHAAQSFVFQQPILLRRSVRDNIAYPLRLRGIAKAMARAQADTAGTRVGLGPMLDRPATFLSGGERQKLAIARALITKPALLFLDEPCASLDGRATREIEEILRQAATSGTRLIMSTHDMGQARRLADDVLFLLKGHIHEHAPTPLFFDQPQTAEAAAFLNGDIVE
ncbi:tungstate transport system ATP-binding protein [Aliiroseovarius halocynthiae]|uniref:ATP-binding cassette domain-containing protein n=1 Tax=Aliiroseovarius halocynthiae TaxID=985055 RepID=A0A545SQ69_9RHOB|nr:ATP-binding cassette domain-containing protein [Aliiroseovarius halocynthiae]TQV67104.1 ATP-binding cassette domain-containing protein [Aliiroseovarius halocynthiae]SMR82170.1 tungstate transport system ATP-binding protein [Aliiroseovarius halocynthiae]